MKEILNAKIISTFLGYEDHGRFVYRIIVDYGSTQQGLGDYVLDTFIGSRGKCVGSSMGMDKLMDITKTVGVDSWENLKGKHIRVEREDHLIKRIGNILMDKWFDPNEG